MCYAGNRLGTSGTLDGMGSLCFRRQLSGFPPFGRIFLPLFRQRNRPLHGQLFGKLSLGASELDPAPV